jgi:hypothetical protein
VPRAWILFTATVFRQRLFFDVNTVFILAILKSAFVSLMSEDNIRYPYT